MITGKVIHELIALVETHFPLSCERFCENCGKLEGEHAAHGDFCPSRSEDELFSSIQRFSPVGGTLAAENSASSAGSLQKGRGLPEISQRFLNPSDAGLGRENAALPRKLSLPSISLGRCDYSDGYAQCSQTATIVLVDPDNDWYEFEFCADHYQSLVRTMRKQAQ